MNVEHKDGAFFIQKDGQQAGLLTYTKLGNDRISLDHTEVDDLLKGQGAGKQLVKAAVDFARAKGLKIIPSCPFAAHLFEKETAWQDLL
jgi:predicted GNAT family acetyltransferase